MCSTKIYIKLCLFFLAVCQPVGSIFDVTTELGSNVKSAIFSKHTAIPGANSTETERNENRTPVSYQPPRFIMGNSKPGTIESCLFDNPQHCDSLTKGGGVSINAIALSAEHIYAGLESGAIWRCLMWEKDSCVEIIKTNSAVKSIAVAFEFIYAGLKDGTLRRCRVDKENSCIEFRKEGASVNAIAAKDRDYVYAGWGLQIMKCAQRHNRLSCTPYYREKNSITALATFTDKFIFVGLHSGALLRCPLHNKMDPCLLVANADSGIYSLYVFNGHLYASLDSGAMLRCPVSERANCEQPFARKQGRFSFAITYGTMPLFKRVRGEDKSCSWQKVAFVCPPYVFYYDYRERTGFELNIKHGEVFHSSGERFDTSEADPCPRGNKAIFVMDSVGRIYASNRNPVLLVHHSSLLAGQPVSAAGEMEVKRGVITSINNFSGHYRVPPDVNNQVLDALRIKGYTKPIEVRACSELAFNASLYLQTLGQPAESEMPTFCDDHVINTH